MYKKNYIKYKSKYLELANTQKIGGGKKFRDFINSRRQLDHDQKREIIDIYDGLSEIDNPEIFRWSIEDNEILREWFDKPINDRKDSDPACGRPILRYDEMSDEEVQLVEVAKKTEHLRENLERDVLNKKKQFISLHCNPDKEIYETAYSSIYTLRKDFLSKLSQKINSISDDVHYFGDFENRIIWNVKINSEGELSVNENTIEKIVLDADNNNAPTYYIFDIDFKSRMGGHANLLVYNRIYHTLQRIEPHGSMSPKIFKAETFDKKISTHFSNFLWRNKIITFISPSCDPHIGMQGLENFSIGCYSLPRQIPKYEQPGFCFPWTIAFLEFKILDRELNSSNLHEEFTKLITETCNKDDPGLAHYKFILGYSHTLIEEYLLSHFMETIEQRSVVLENYTKRYHTQYELLKIFNIVTFDSFKLLIRVGHLFLFLPDECKGLTTEEYLRSNLYTLKHIRDSYKNFIFVNLNRDTISMPLNIIFEHINNQWIYTYLK